MKPRGRGETIVSGSQGKMIIVFEQFGSELPATKVKKKNMLVIWFFLSDKRKHVSSSRETHFSGIKF